MSGKHLVAEVGKEVNPFSAGSCIARKIIEDKSIGLPRDARPRATVEGGGDSTNKSRGKDEGVSLLLR